MSSLLTNASAMTALQTLNKTNASMSQVQSRISTGLRVAGAQDNAAYWSIATTMRSDNLALSAVKDALGLGAATVDVQYTALNESVKKLDDIKAKLVAARQPGVDRDKIQADITSYQNDLKTLADSAVFNGENWLSVNTGAADYNATKSIVGSFSRVGGAITIDTIDINIAQTTLYDSNAQGGILDRDRTSGGTTAKVSTIDISALTDSAADLTTLEETISIVDAAIQDLTNAATLLGSAKTRVDGQKSFVGALTDAIDRGIGQLVDADMNSESTRLQALQVQQQLGIQALSIANSSSQNILSLFR
ncbi:MULTISPECIES: flagellin [unclassified Pannonibacter]|uniref:flagellin N-terminal helical domain-containing protein n=1 Tax=unclassified Pannonibacter TaxID=2627228 RepID=UPI0016443C6C|nr:MULTISPECIES: flagellin [unclassified Pannonibacter]